MGVLARAVKAAAYIRIGGTGQGWSTPVASDVIYSSPWLESRSSTGITVTDEKAMSFVPFFAGVRLLSETVGRMPMVLYERKGDDERERARGKLLYGILHDEPNPEMSAMTFRSALHGHIICRGNAFAEQVRDDLGRVTELWPLRPDRMQVLLDTGTGRKFYRYRTADGDYVDLRQDQVFHVPGFGYDGRVGYSLVSLFRDSLALGLSAQEFGAKFFKTGARPAGIITHPAGMAPEVVDRVLGTFQNRVAGLSNAQRIGVLEEGFNWQAVGLSLDDSQFMETRNFQAGETATMLGIPPHLIGDVSRSTSWGTGIEEQTLGFISLGALGAAFDLWSGETNRQLVRPAYGDSSYAEFLLDALLKGRSDQRLNFYQGLWSMGVLNADTIAKKENLPIPEDGSGQTYYRPANFGRALAAVEAMKPTAQSLSDVTNAITALIDAGFDPQAVLAALNQPKIPIVGLQPIAKLGDGSANGNGTGGQPAGFGGKKV